MGEGVREPGKQLNKKILFCVQMSGGAIGRQNSQDFGKGYQYYTLSVN